MRANLILHRRGSYRYFDFEGGITIREKQYYNQKCVITEIHKQTGYSVNDIARILHALENVVKEKCSDSDEYVEIKLFSGLKVTAKYILPEHSKSNLDISGLDFILSLNASFSDHFKKDIRYLHSTACRDLR